MSEIGMTRGSWCSRNEHNRGLCFYSLEGDILIYSNKRREGNRTTGSLSYWKSHFQRLEEYKDARET